MSLCVVIGCWCLLIAAGCLLFDVVWSVVCCFAVLGVCCLLCDAVCCVLYVVIVCCCVLNVGWCFFLLPE